MIKLNSFFSPDKFLILQARWYKQAAEGGYVRAMYNISLCYSFGKGVAKNDIMARKWMKQAADLGHSKAQLEHGLCLSSVCSIHTPSNTLSREHVYCIHNMKLEKAYVQYFL